MSVRHTLVAALAGIAAFAASSSAALATEGAWSQVEAESRAAGVEWVDRHDRGEHEHHRHDHRRKPFSVKIIGFNDYHGNLLSPGTFGVNTSVPAAQRPAVGGADYLAGYVAALKKQNPLNVVVGAGDFIGASPLVSALFFDEPAVETLNKIGLEFNAVGNHEFDKGAAELKRLQRGGCKLTNGVPDPNSSRGLGSKKPGRFDGADFQWLSANVIETASGRTLLPAYGIKKFNGVRVAFIGMTIKGTPSSSRPAA